MERRTFLSSSVAVGAGAIVPWSTNAQPEGSPAIDEDRPKPFTLRFAPHYGMFRNNAGNDPAEQLRFAAAQGFTAWEYPGMGIEPASMQETMAKSMADLGLAMGVFTVSPATIWGPHFVLGKTDSREKFLIDCKKAVETAKRVNATWMIVVPGTRVPNIEMAYQTANVVEQLHYAADIFEKQNMVMVIEPRNPWHDQPNMFLATVPQAYEVCRAVDSPACKILYNIYHQQIAGGNLIPNIDLAWDEIAYFRIGDTPGRFEPGTGEINYTNVLSAISDKGYKGIFGMDHSNSKLGKVGEQAVINAYRKIDVVRDTK